MTTPKKYPPSLEGAYSFLHTLGGLKKTTCERASPHSNLTVVKRPQSPTPREQYPPSVRVTYGTTVAGALHHRAPREATGVSFDFLVGYEKIYFSSVLCYFYLLDTVDYFILSTYACTWAFWVEITPPREEKKTSASPRALPPHFTSLHFTHAPRTTVELTTRE